MFALTYLSNDNKRLLEKLQERYSRAAAVNVRNETELEIQEILARAKPYTLCDQYEADKLRSQLLQKISILTGLGKSTESFRMHLKDVEFHIQTLQMKEVVKEAARPIKPEEPPNLQDKMPTLNQMKKDKKRKEAFGRTRWAIGFDDEPTQ